MELEYATITLSVTTVVVAALLVYILRLIKADNNNEKETRNVVEVPVEPPRQPENVPKASAAATKKKSVEKKQDFSHPWMQATLKGHTGTVQDIDFASNGKFLASCGDEDPDPGGKSDQEDSSGACYSDSSSGGRNHHNSTVTKSPDSSSQSSPRVKGLSRRQRKNRKREETAAMLLMKKRMNSKGRDTHLTREFEELNLSDRDIAFLLRDYQLTEEQRKEHGYPVERNIRDGTFYLYNNTRFQHNFDVNAREFIPGKRDSTDRDSGQGSGSSSDYEDGFSVSHQEMSARNMRALTSAVGRLHTCVRCSRPFKIHNRRYITDEKCQYHWGKLSYRGGERSFGCCQRKAGSPGCTTGPCHVWNGLVDVVGFEFFVYTPHRKTPPADEFYGLYALDCEMSYTVEGLEVTKVTVVAADGRLVYDSFVRPINQIVDYNTRFSGVTASNLRGAKSLKRVQNDLMGFINADTILVGHGLENDLRALRIYHETVVDTAKVFPHPSGLPYRRSLKNLMLTTFNREIQCGKMGHDSYEDASACMELMLHKVRTKLFSKSK